MKKNILTTCSLASALSAIVQGQSTLLNQTAVNPDTSFGRAVARAGDLDFDGIDEYLVTSNGPPVAGFRFGLVSVYSGASAVSGFASPLTSIPGPVVGVPPNFIPTNFGASVDGGADLDGDGLPDFVVGAPDTGMVFAYAGVSWQNLMPGTPNLFGPTGHGAVVRFMNANNDGIPDLLVTRRPNLAAPAPPATWEVINGAWIRSGGTVGIRTVHTGSGLAANMTYGTTAAIIGDLDGDGSDEFVIGGPGGDAAWPTGYVEVRSGANGALIRQLAGLVAGVPGNGFGTSLARAGDWDADGLVDLIVGMPGFALPIAGGTSRGAVEVISGAYLMNVAGSTRSIFFRNGSVANEQIGRVVASADVNADGFLDALFRSRPTATTGSLTAVSGRTKTDMWVKASSQPGMAIGGITALDGGAYLVAGDPQDATAGPNAGSVEFFRGHDGRGVLSTLGIGCPCGVDSPTTGCPNVLGISAPVPYGSLLAVESGSVSAGAANITVAATGGIPGGLLQLWGGSPLAVPLVNGNGLLGLIGNPIPYIRLGLGAFDSKGTVVLGGNFIGTSGALVGQTLALQGTYRDANCSTIVDTNWTNSYLIVIAN